MRDGLKVKVQIFLGSYSDNALLQLHLLEEGRLLLRYPYHVRCFDAEEIGVEGGDV